jgi:hypothetical protein
MISYQRPGCYYSHISCWSVPSLDLSSLLNFPTFFQRCNNIFDIIAFRENSLIFFEKIADPRLCQERESLRLSRLNIAIIVENSYLILSGFLFMLQDKLFDIFTSFEELFFIFNFEDSFSPLFPRLTLDYW